MIDSRATDRWLFEDIQGQSYRENWLNTMLEDNLDY